MNIGKATLFYLGMIKHLQFSPHTITIASDEWIETCHGHVQWYFPTDQPSNYNPDAPILTLDDLPFFMYSSTIDRQVRKNVEAFMKFLSINYSDTYVVYEPRAHWITPKNHNLLRITRLLRFLYLIDMGYESIAIYDALCNMSPEAKAIIGDETFAYWKAAFTDIPIPNPTLASSLKL